MYFTMSRGEFTHDYSRRYRILSFILRNNTFSECVIYIKEDISKKSPDAYLQQEISKFKNNNKVINHKFIRELCEYFDNDLDKAPAFITKGLDLDNENLTNVKLPTYIDFFKYSIIQNIILPAIDFSLYNLDTTSFTQTTFDNNSNFSSNFWRARFHRCKLPRIDFSRILLPLNKPLTCERCEFPEGTIFPNDKYFFKKNNLERAYLPPYDYSDYIISPRRLCSFNLHSDSKLPKEYLSHPKFRYVGELKNIPTKYLSDCVRFSEIGSPEQFLQKYKDQLSEEDIRLMYVKYPYPHYCMG